MDGDTVRTPSGERIRLIGVNSPELGRRGQPGEPFSRQARKALGDYVRAGVRAGERFAIRVGEDARDRHGRTLAHVRRTGGWDLSARQLHEGLGMQVVVGRNIGQVACYRRMERAARKADRGVWGHAEFRPVPAAAVGPRDTGFRRLRGTVVSVGTTRGAYWLELDGPVVVRLARRYLPDHGRGQALVGRGLETRGWLVDRAGSPAVRNRGHRRFLLRVDHPVVLEWRRGG